AFQPVESARKVVDLELAVDHRPDAARHLLQGTGDIGHATAKTAEDPDLLLEQLVEVDLGADAGGRAAGDQPAAPLERQHAAAPGVGADMLEDDVDAPLAGDAAHQMLEPLGAIVDDVISAERR